MKHLELKKDGSVFVVTMIDDANSNTFTMDMITEFNAIYDEIEKTPGDAAMVLTSSSAKFFCNGINLQWYLEQTEENQAKFLYEFKKFFLRSSLMNLPTVGCITGHAFAGGAILASSMDFRIMRNDRAKFCFPEVTYNMPLGDTLIAVIKNLPNPSAVDHLVLTGMQWKGDECLKNGIVTSIWPEEELFPKAMAFANELATKKRENFTGLKYDVKSALHAMWKAQHIK